MWKKVEASESLLTAKEAAEFLNVSVKSLYKWTTNDKIPYVRLGRTLRFRQCDLRQYIEDNYRGKTARFLRKSDG